MVDFKRRGARYRARRRAVDILFEAETRDLDPVGVVQDRIELSQDPRNAVAPVADYSRDIIVGCAEMLDEIDDSIERYLAEDWELHRLPAVDRQILRVTAWEILFNDDVDAAVSISNALEMAQEYAGAAAPPYIHAVLDDIVQSTAANKPQPEASEDIAAETEVQPGFNPVEVEPAVDQPAVVEPVVVEPVAEPKEQPEVLGKPVDSEEAENPEGPETPQQIISTR